MWENGFSTAPSCCRTSKTLLHCTQQFAPLTVHSLFVGYLSADMLLYATTNACACAVLPESTARFFWQDVGGRGLSSVPFTICCGVGLPVARRTGAPPSSRLRLYPASHSAKSSRLDLVTSLEFMVGEVRVRQGLSGTTTVTACLSTIYHQGVPRACACPPFTKPCRYCQESDTEDSAEHWNDDEQRGRGLSDNVRDKEDDEKKKIWI